MRNGDFHVSWVFDCGEDVMTKIDDGADDKENLIEALKACRKALLMMIMPAEIAATSFLQAFAMATEAEFMARKALEKFGDKP